MHDLAATAALVGAAHTLQGDYTFSCGAPTVTEDAHHDLEFMCGDLEDLRLEELAQEPDAYTYPARCAACAWEGDLSNSAFNDAGYFTCPRCGHNAGRDEA